MPEIAEQSASIPIFIAQLDHLGGAERSVLAMAAWFHRQGIPAHVLAYQDNCDFASYATFPLRVDQLRPQGGARAKVAALRQYFRTNQALRPPLVNGFQPALHATLAGVGKFHCLMHDTPSLFGDANWRPWQGRLRISISSRIIAYGLRRGHGRMIVTSEYLQADCRREFGLRADIARMGGFGTAEDFKRRPVTDELRLLSVSRIEHNKRIDWMLDALAELEHAQVPLSARVPWRFDVAGKGALLEPMRKRAAELGLGERVHFHGFVPDEELDRLYDRAHLFLMPAVQGYGIPAIEALQRGIPVLLHRESGVSDILLDTPWASVLTGGKEQMRPKLEAMIEFLLANEQMRVEPLENLPSEDAWAERVARLCGYVEGRLGSR